MRLLHTADWHVGKTLRGRSRADEHRAVLREMAEVAASEQVDLAIVAGDLFDTAAPAPESEGIVYRALLDLAATGAHVVLIAGNHDNPRRLEAVRPLLRLGRVTTAARVARPEHGGVVEVRGRSGETARLALLPFLSQREVVRADQLIDRERFAAEHSGAYEHRIRRLVEALSAGARSDAVNVLVAHLTVVGGTLGGGERHAHTVFDYAVPATAFPAALHYVALGHLHRPQRLPAPCPVWYAGSPLQLDFGEARDDKAVLLVDVAPGRPADVRPVALRAGRRLRTLRGTLAELHARGDEVGDDHLRVVVRERARPGLADEVRRRFAAAVDVVVESPDAPAIGASPAPRLGRSPQELFGAYLQEKGVDDPSLRRLFAQVYEDVTGP